MPSLYEQLRMQNIFGGLTPPNMSGGYGDANNMINNVSQILDARRRQAESEQNYQASHKEDPTATFMKNMAATQQINKPMDVVFHDTHPDITPLQKGELAVQNKKETEKDTLAKAKLAQGEENIGVKRQDSAIRLGRAAVYKFKAEHPNVQVIKTLGGNVHYYDPATKQMIDSGIDSGTLSTEDELNLKGDIKAEQIDQQGNINKDIQDTRGKQRLEQIGAQGENQSNLQGMRGEQALTDIGARGEQNLKAIAARVAGQKDVNANKPSGSTSVSEKVTPAKPGLFGSESTWLGATPEKKITTTTTKQPMNATSEVDKPPAGAKPGGKWIDTKYGRVYMEP